ncbi:hypothetical protein [Streptomyces sp. NPDC002913]
MTAWTPALIWVDNVAAYGPYMAEIDVEHSRRSVWERPRFDRATVQKLMTDHEAVNRGHDPESTVTLSWDGDDVIVANGTRYSSGEPGLTERIHPDADGRYAMLPDWCWDRYQEDEDL